MPSSLLADSAVVAWPFDWMSIPQRPDTVLRRMHRPASGVVGWGAGRAEGWGTHVNDAGDCYQGQFHGGKRHGLGRFTWAATGEAYEGEWADDLRQARLGERL